MIDDHDKILGEIVEAVGRGMGRAAFIIAGCVVIAGIVVMAIGAVWP